ncbi:universal stress protein [Streptomyces sp. SID14478]|uniref:universal stress protein n=1 Tax=Streptomyces sp. SID14478 TaxID=2706073 RepID=UPI0013DCC1A5|nr:universal stress protein [Streptomyces sp. SID14478]NEB74248.1 universal stress protein [Streptomyces sp. SID14478]
MKSQHPVVVGVDGSRSSLRAINWAADEAELHEVPLRVVHASLWQRYETGVETEDPDPFGDRRLIDEALSWARAQHPGVKVLYEVLPEEPRAALLREARSARLLVLGSRGRGSIPELLLGSVSLGVAARANCPVVVLRGRQDNRVPAPGRNPVLVGVAHSPETSTAVQFAQTEALLRKAPLTAIRAWHCPPHETIDHPLLSVEPARLYERRAAAMLGSATRHVPDGVDIRRVTVEGTARRVLLDASYGGGLLVVGARRRHGQVGLQLGRVGHALLHHAACPVVIVPEQV